MQDEGCDDFQAIVLFIECGLAQLLSKDVRLLPNEVTLSHPMRPSNTMTTNPLETTEQSSHAGTLGGRLKIAFLMSNLRPPELSKMTGIPVATINALTRRGSERSAYTEQLLAAIPQDRVSHDWIRTGKGPRKPPMAIGGAVESMVLGSTLTSHPDLGAALEGVRLAHPTSTFVKRKATVVTSCDLEHAAAPDGVHVAFRMNTASTIGRVEFDELIEKFAQDSSFVIHLALARLRDAVNAGETISVTFGPAPTKAV